MAGAARSFGKTCRAALLAALLPLVGCGEFELPQFGAGKAPGAAAGAQAPASSIPPKPPGVQPVADGTVVVAAPPGYCIDERASKTGRKPFVLLASCAAISQTPEHPAPGRRGLITATVGEEGSGQAPINPDLMGGYFRSAKGRAALANAGVAQDVSILDSQVRGRAFFLALRDRGEPARPELGQARWRAFFTVNGRMVSLVLYSLKGQPLATEAGIGLLEDFSRQIIAQSAG